MTHCRWMNATAALAVLTLLGTPAFALDEKKVKIEDLPKAVAAAAQKAFPAARMVGAVQETDDDDKDDILYVVELQLDGKTVELAVDADGTIEAVEKEIDAADLPKAVTRAAAQRFPNGKVAKVAEVSDADDDVVYELDIMDNGKKLEVVMSPNGKILDIDEDGDDDKKDKDQDRKKDDKKAKKKDDGKKKDTENKGKDNR